MTNEAADRLRDLIDDAANLIRSYAPPDSQLRGEWLRRAKHAAPVLSALVTERQRTVDEIWDTAHRFCHGDSEAGLCKAKVCEPHWRHAIDAVAGREADPVDQEAADEWEAVGREGD